MAATGPTAVARPMSTLRIVLLLGALEVFGPLSMDLYLPALPELAAHLDTSDTLAQATMSTCMIGLGVGQLINGPLADRIGRRRPVLVGVALFVVLSLACAFAPNIQVLLILRALQGLAGSAGMVLAMAMARDMFNGPELSRMLSLLAIVSTSAPILAPILGGQLVKFMDWRGLFLVLTGIGAFIFVVSLLGLRETLPVERRQTGGLRELGGQFLVLKRDPLFLSTMLVTALAGTAFFTYLSMSSFVFQGYFGLDATQFSYVFTANSLALLAGAQLSGLLVRRAGPRRIYVAGFSLSVVATGVLTLVSIGEAGFAPFLAALLLFTITFGQSMPNSNAIAMHDHGARAGTASSLMGLTGFAVGPIIAPIVSLLGTNPTTMALTMFVTAVGATAVVWLLVRPMMLRRGR